jgi:phytoene dehydrogenase-like protein
VTENRPPVAIVGAGPTGLFAAYYAGFRGMSVAIVDSLPEPGGQITAMYPEKQIFDVAGFPAVLGRDLVGDGRGEPGHRGVHAELRHQPRPRHGRPRPGGAGEQEPGHVAQHASRHPDATAAQRTAGAVAESTEERERH